MYKPLLCKKCGGMVFDEADVASLVRADGLSKSLVDCPCCGYRWGLVSVSDCTGWIACLMPPEAVDDVYQAFSEARNIGASVKVVSAVLDGLIARVEAEK